MTSSEDAVSEAIGGVLLIALVLIGAAHRRAPTCCRSPCPRRSRRCSSASRRYGGNIYPRARGRGEPERGRSSRSSIDGVTYRNGRLRRIESGGSTRWTMGDRISITEHAGAESVGLVYSGGSGETLLRSSSSPGGFDYVFPSSDPTEVVDVPPPFSRRRDDYGDLAWQFPDRPATRSRLFPPIQRQARLSWRRKRTSTMHVPSERAALRLRRRRRRARDQRRDRDGPGRDRRASSTATSAAPAGSRCREHTTLMRPGVARDARSRSRRRRAARATCRSRPAPST